MELLRLFLETKQIGKLKSMLNYFLNTYSENLWLLQKYTTAIPMPQTPFIL